MALQYGMSQRTMGRLLKEDLNVHSYRLKPRQLLSEATKAKRYTRCKAVLKRMNDGTLPNPVFSDSLCRPS